MEPLAMDDLTEPAVRATPALGLRPEPSLVEPTTNPGPQRRWRIAGRGAAPAIVDGPLVVAHRGYSSRAPENTLLAIDLGILAGADLVECDVRTSADGMAVLFHDPTLKRVTGSSGKLAARSLEQLRALEVGRWKGEQFAGLRIPTLEEALRFVAGRCRLVIEVKDRATAAAVATAIERADAPAEGVLLISFYYETLLAIHERMPTLDALWLVKRPPKRLDHWRRYLETANAAQLVGVGMPVTKATAEHVAAAHAADLAVLSWTANERDTMESMLEIGVDAICTDYPEDLKALIRPAGPPEAAA